MKARSKLLLAGLALALPACSTVGDEGYGSQYYSLVRVRRIAVGDGSLVVTPPRPYNRQRPTFFDDIRAVEDWTLNGPYLWRMR